MKLFKTMLFLVLAVVLVGSFATRMAAQSVVSGEVEGLVTDPTGAVVPNASVNLASSETGFNASTTTGSTGTFRFALVKPGNYTVTVTTSGFRTVKSSIIASLGQITNVPIRLEVGVKAETIEITGEAPLLNTDNANLATTVDDKTIGLIPSPGQDITNYAMTTPGVTVSSGSGYGNFTANGLPGTSNLYTVNGNDYNDPYLNLNNSGASNLLLGANELQEITVVTNGYTGEYGRAAGANVNYTTKSGTNQFHGNATWFYNGNVMNANDWFNNSSATPRPHEVSNQWAGSFGGPIKKDKLFFFYDNEGLRYVLPGGGPAFVPTSAYSTALLANIAANGPAGSTAFYTKIATLYAGATGISRATPVAVGLATDTNPNGDNGGCGDFSTTATGATNTYWGDVPRDANGNALNASSTAVPCAQTFRSTVNNLNTEWLQSFTVDLNLTDKDTFKFRVKTDRGVQATGTDAINPLFNANSVQPEDDGQMLWTHVINSHTTNQFVMSGLYYSAIFGPPNLTASLALFPTTIGFSDGVFNNMGGGDNVYPQGRNVTQYQFVDDFSWTKGAHGIKFGVNIRRNDISSYAAGPGTSGLITINSMTDFWNGTAANGSNMAQSFANNGLAQPVAYYSLGLYIQDEWRVNSKLKVTLALRADRNSNEVCQHNCFSRPAGSFLNAADPTGATPYNSTILTGLKQAFPGLQAVGWGPRVGFAYSPMSTLVVRGGFGIFTDLYQGLIADRFITNTPNETSFTILSGPFAPGVAGNVFDQAAADNAGLVSGFKSGGTLASISEAVPGFTVPNLNTMVKNVTNPHYYEWNMQVEKSFGPKTSFSINYIGNHGSNLFIRNLGLNAYCTPTAATAAPPPSLATTIAHCPNGFADLPTAVPDPRFGISTELQNNGISNYDGATATVTRKFGYGFQGTFNYTYSHSLDDISNGGLEPYNANYYGGAASSFRVAIDPYNLKGHNYANSDYNFPHSISANYFWELPIKSANHALNAAIGGWSIAGTFFYKSGEPFSVYNSKIASSLLGNGSSMRILADFVSGTRNCSGPNQCLSASQFAPPVSPGTDKTGAALPPSYTYAQTNFGNTNRNFFTGPNYFNADFSLQKAFKIRENMTFTLGANAFNVFNHPNFDNPVGSISSGLFGQVLETVTPPNSPYGNFQGAAVSGRVLQIDLKFKF